MDERVADPVAFDEVKAVHQIVAEATCALYPSISLSRKIRRMEILRTAITKKSWGAFVGMLILAILAFISSGIFLVTQSNDVLLIVKILGTFSIVAGVLVFVLTIAADVPLFMQSAKEPYSVFLASVESAATFDLQYISRLALHDERAVKYVAAYYRHARIEQEKRAGLLSGSIEKIGFFPALAAVVLLWIALSRVDLFNGWFFMLVWLLLAFHILNFSSFLSQQRTDRVLAMLDVSLAIRPKG